jgi:hypothetical protein
MVSFEEPPVVNTPALAIYDISPPRLDTMPAPELDRLLARDCSVILFRTTFVYERPGRLRLELSTMDPSVQCDWRTLTCAVGAFEHRSSAVARGKRKKVSITFHDTASFHRFLAHLITGSRT